MEFKELKNKKQAELEKMLAHERGVLYDLRLKLSINQLKDVRAVRSTKKNISRISTQLNAIEYAEKSE